mmetsp:Transcript_44173/g.50834  ORF Transcript_44173/g.50834 Transcript_44173/m.50834 type:complete len:84 (+) Transcript_44173:168-419(+)
MGDRTSPTNPEDDDFINKYLTQRGDNQNEIIFLKQNRTISKKKTPNKSLPKPTKNREKKTKATILTLSPPKKQMTQITLSHNS